MDVSIIIPYNTDRGYLAGAIDSCLEQQFTGTFEVCSYQGDQIVSKNFNDAVRITTGEFVKLMAEDDLLLPNCIQDLYNGMENFDMVCSYVWDFNAKINRPFYSEIPIDIRSLTIDNTIHGLSTMYRRSSLEKVAVNGEYMRETWQGKVLDCAEEYELHLRMMRAGMKIGLVKSFVARYRLHRDQKSNVFKGQRMKDRFDTIMSIKRYYECFNYHPV